MAINKLKVARAVKQNKYLLINVSLGKKIFKRSHFETRLTPAWFAVKRKVFSFVLAKEMMVRGIIRIRWQLLLKLKLSKPELV